MKIYGDRRSGNCQKVQFTADYLGLNYQWIDVDIIQGGSRTKDYLDKNPAGQVPMVELDDGRVLSQSNAIICYLAKQSDLLPTDAWAFAKVQQWLFWEQYSHEPYVAVTRFQKLYLGVDESELDQEKLKRGNQALDLMNDHLSHHAWLASMHVSVADIALVAYTRLAHEGGYNLSPRTHVKRWIKDVADALQLPPA